MAAESASSLGMRRQGVRWGREAYAAKEVHDLDGAICSRCLERHRFDPVLGRAVPWVLGGASLIWCLPGPCDPHSSGKL
jgi:hypothetical protein